MLNNRISIITITCLINFLSSFNVHADGNETAALISQAIQAEHRSAQNKARDIYRHPKETLEFFGLKKEMTVLEILPGAGWYTEILAPVLKNEGLLTVASFGENHPTEYLRNIHVRYMKHLASNPAVYSKVRHELFEDDGYLGAIATGSKDMVVTFRNTHNWIRYGGIKEIFRAFNRVLKKGGVLGVVQHRADKGGKANETAEKGYVPGYYLIKLIESAGFELVDKSGINANHNDTKDYPDGVWSLPPTYRGEENNKQKYSAIGESDRMTLRFIKL